MFKSQLRSKEDILAIRAAEEEYAQRKLVAQETLKLVREELTNCYVEHGVNHKIACKGLREEYAVLVRDPTHGAGLPVRTNTMLAVITRCAIWRGCMRMKCAMTYVLC